MCLSWLSRHAAQWGDGDSGYAWHTISTTKNGKTRPEGKLEIQVALTKVDDPHALAYHTYTHMMHIHLHVGFFYLAHVYICCNAACMQ